MKKIVIVVWLISFVAFIGFWMNYTSNEKMILDYNNGEYSKSKFELLGFTEPYIAPYNLGNIYYKKGDYENALEQYRKALSKNPTFHRECKVRINIALCMVTPIDFDQVKEEDVEDVIQTLEAAKDVLMEHGCAHEEDPNGHNKDAQQLKEDIDEMIKQLNEHKNGENDKPTPTEAPQNNEPKEEDDPIRQQLQEYQNQGIHERINELNDVNQMRDYEYYDGMVW